MPSIYVIGGPNGAGKTTTALSLLPIDLQCGEFVNADLIAAGLSPFHTEDVAMQAGRLMLERIHRLAERRADFAFETTMATRSFTPFLRGCRENGYTIHILFLWLRTVELALARVADRVKQGGHNIPEIIVRRRYQAGIQNMRNLYIPIADSWEIYDNSDDNPEFVARQDSSGIVVNNETIWTTIRESCQ